MIAICVILAAVVAAYVFGMGSEQHVPHAVTVKPMYNSGDLVITYYGGDGATMLDHLILEVNGVTKPDWIPTGVGNSTTITGPYSTPTKLLIKAVYSDDLMNEHIVMNQNI